MDSLFDDEIFGQLVHPKPGKKQVMNQQQNNSKGITNSEQELTNNQFYGNKHLQNTKPFFQKEKSECETCSNSGSYSSGWNMMFNSSKQKNRQCLKPMKGLFVGVQQDDKPETKQKLQEILEGKKFLCPICHKEQKPMQDIIKENQCLLCKGKKLLDRNSNVLKFFQYLIQFKMGNKQSYSITNSFVEQIKQKQDKYQEDKKKSINKQQKIKSKIVRKATFNNFGQQNQENCQQFSISKYSSSICYNERISLNNSAKPETECKSKLVVSFQQFKKKLCQNNEIIEQSYICDGCEVSPIIGKRFHCNHLQCDHDFDLCEKCFQEKGHQHQMIQIDDTQKALKKRQKIFENLLSSTFKGVKKLNSKSNNIRNQNNQVQNSPRIFLSSIH